MTGTSLSRRQFVAGAAAAASLPLVADAPAIGRDRPRWMPPNGPGLQARAARTGRIFGCAVKSSQIAKDPAFIDAVRREAGGLVQEYELKRYVTEKKRGKYDFSGTDAIVGLADEEGMAARGHTLCWYAGNPDWLESALAEANSHGRERLLADYIGTAMRRYAGRIGEWDVVNEAVEPNENARNGMRADSIWHKAMGEYYIDHAFQLAREVDPHPTLFLTDFGVEHDSPRCEARRTAVLKLVERLKSRGVPVGAFGVQGHLKPFREGFDQRIFADFLDRLTGMGLELAVTEFDLADRGGPADVRRRDAEVAAVGRAFLDVALANPRTRSVYCWGLSDRYSWLSTYPEYKWPGGVLSRGLPLDGELKRKPLWGAIADAFDAAPARAGAAGGGDA